MIIRWLGIWIFISWSIWISCCVRVLLVWLGVVLLEGWLCVSIIVVVLKCRVCLIIFWGCILVWLIVLVKSVLWVINWFWLFRYNIWNFFCLSVVICSCSYLCMVWVEVKVMLGLCRWWFRVLSVCWMRCWFCGVILLGKKESCFICCFFG